MKVAEGGKQELNQMKGEFGDESVHIHTEAACGREVDDRRLTTLKKKYISNI